MESKNLKSWLEEGPFTLALCSSFFGFFSHTAVVQFLYEQGFRPQKITGTSAGALVGGALASGLAPEDFREILFSMRQKDFWDPKLGLGLLEGRKFLSLMEKHFVPNFAKAKIPLAVGALDVFTMRTKFLQEGSLPKAVFASCAVPGMFHPVKIGRRFYLDGGVFNKSGVDPKTEPQERVLNIFFESRDISRLYEQNFFFKRLDSRHRVLRFRNIPRVSFNSMEKGPAAFAEMYLRTQKAFAATWEKNILEA